MSWGANAVARFAEDMSILCENNQAWLDKSRSDLENKRLRDRFYEILGIDPYPDIFPMEYEVNDPDRQLAVFALAIASGTRFEFLDGKCANGWIRYMVGGCGCSSYAECLNDYLTPKEQMAFAVAD